MHKHKSPGRKKIDFGRSWFSTRARLVRLSKWRTRIGFDVAFPRSPSSDGFCGKVQHDKSLVPGLNILPQLLVSWTMFVIVIEVILALKNGMCCHREALSPLIVSCPADVASHDISFTVLKIGSIRSTILRIQTAGETNRDAFKKASSADGQGNDCDTPCAQKMVPLTFSAMSFTLRYWLTNSSC